METVLAEIGIPAGRVSACDGAALSRAQFPRLTIRARYLWKMSPSEIACFLSHRSVWEQIVSDEIAFAVIFEDDILISPSIIRLLKTTDWIPPGVDCVKLDMPGGPAVQDTPIPIAGNEFALSTAYSILGGTAAYILSLEGARQLLERTKIIGGPVDNALFGPQDPAFAGLSFRQLHPAVCLQQMLRQQVRFLPEGAEVSGIDHGGIWRKKRMRWKKQLSRFGQLRLRMAETRVAIKWFFTVRYLRMRYGAAPYMPEFYEDIR